MPRVVRYPAIALVILCSVALALVASAGRAGPVVVYHLPATSIHLGDRINADPSQCDFGHGETSVPCYSPSDDVVFSYDYRERIVTQISYFTFSKVNAGQLIVSWGVPNSYTHQGSFVAMVWRSLPARSAWVYDPFFSPTSRVSFIRVGKLPDESELQPWRGFIQRSDP